MYKKLVVITIFLSGLVSAKPPKLGWEYGWCYNNAFVQILYNAHLLTECLLKEAETCKKKNPILAKYIDLLKAIKKNPDIVYTEMWAFHKEWCAALKRDPNVSGDILSPDDWLTCCETLFGHTSGRFGRGPTPNPTKPTPQIFSVADTQVVSRLVEPPVYWWLKVEVKPYKPITESSYNYFTVDQTFTTKFPRAGVTATYELIGMAVYRPNHFVAYVKDQWEEPAHWYFCNDYVNQYDKVDAPPLTWPQKYGDGYTTPTVLIYKKVSEEKMGGPADQDAPKILDNLVESLRMLAQ